MLGFSRNMPGKEEQVSVIHSGSGFVQQFGRLWPQCIVRAWQDTAFREALKRDPMGTLQSSYQFSFPQGIKLKVTEAHEAPQAVPADTLRMVIPPPPARDVGEHAF